MFNGQRQEKGKKKMETNLVKKKLEKKKAQTQTEAGYEKRGVKRNRVRYSGALDFR